MCVAEMSHADSKIIADKPNGTLSVIIDDKEYTAPALYGKKKLDTIDIDSLPDGVAGYVTPAGVFNTKHYYSATLKEPVIAFVEGNKTLLAMHPVWLGYPEQKRQERLDSPTPDDNNITNGCINVPTKFFYDYMLNLPNGTPLYIVPYDTAENQ
jgi:hypothetical protein